MADYEESDVESDTAFDEISDNRETLVKGPPQSLGLARNYVPKWKPRDAFREYFQNWVDRITDRNRLSRGEIKYETNDTPKIWSACAYHPSSQKLLGYIKFDKNKGELELTNFKAHLSRSALDMGESTKRGDNNQAGTHGEGFKVASLVMVRSGYQVRYESSRFYWRFQFGGRNKRHLYCYMSPMKETKVDKLKAEDSARIARGLRRDLQSNIWEDVTVRIGRLYGSKKNESLSISFSDFKNWIDISFELNKPLGTIETTQGSLVLDDKFKSRVYLKGLYLCNDSASSKTLRFCYNFATGEVNRDRERLTSSTQEALTLSRMWGEAIKSHPQEALPHYAKMLLEDDLKHYAEDYLSRETALKVFEYLRELTDHQNSFYCHQKTSTQDFAVVRSHLNKRPISLPTCLWEPFQKFNLVRTPHEQQIHLLHTAPVAQKVFTPFADGFERSLRSALALDDKTKKLEILFRRGGSNGLDLLLLDGTLEVNDKFLDFHTSHQNTSCQLSRTASQNGFVINHFSCHHIVSRLHKLALEELSRQSGPQPVDIDIETLSQNVYDGLQQMPHKIEAKPRNNIGEIEVSWVSIDGGAIFEIHQFALEYEVTLHRDIICYEQRKALLRGSQPSKCNCPFQVVSGFKATFSDLLINAKYFPMHLKSRNPSKEESPMPSSQPYYGSGNFGSDPDSDDDTDPPPSKLNTEAKKSDVMQKSKDAPKYATVSSEPDVKESSQTSTPSSSSKLTDSNYGSFFILGGTKLSGAFQSKISDNIDTKRVEIAELKSQLAQAKLTIDDCRVKKQRVIELETKISELESQLTQANNTINQLRVKEQRASEESEREIGWLKDEIGIHADEYGKMNKIASDLETAAKLTNQKFESEKKVLNSKFEECKEDAKNKENTINSLRSELSATQKSVIDHEKTISTFRSELTSIQASLTTKENELSTLRSTLTSLRTSTSSLSTSSTTIKIENDATPTNSSHEDLRAAKAKISTLTQELQELQDQNSKLKLKLETAEEAFDAQLMVQGHMAARLGSKRRGRESAAADAPDAKRVRRNGPAWMTVKNEEKGKEEIVVLDD